MAPILYCRCSNCVCKATVLLTDTIKINGTSQEREDVPDVEKVSVMIEEYVEHNESRKENVEMRGGGVELELEGGSGAQPPLESLLSLIILLVILICKSGRDRENIALSSISLLAVSLKIYNNVTKTLMKGKTSTFRLSKELGGVELGFTCFARKIEEKRTREGYFEDDFSRLIHSFRDVEDRNMGRLAQHRVRKNKPGYASMPALVHIL